MPVTVRPTKHPARRWYSHGCTVEKEIRYVYVDCRPNQDDKVKAIVRSSYDDVLTSQTVGASVNGFLYACMDAYSNHNHLVLRAEDVWLAILCQLNFYINRHAEELRSFFVSHTGQRDLVIHSAAPLASADFDALAVRLAELMGKHLNDPSLLPWVLPDFTTTTPTDRAIASLLMMGAFREYFNANMWFLCGIPSVTLLGERADWEHLAQRLDRIPALGAEPAQFAALLRPVLKYMVLSFDEPESDVVVDFWNKITHESSGSGTHQLSGWLTAFCFWEADGKPLYKRPHGPVEINEGNELPNPGCNLDGVLYHRISSKQIPAGTAEIPVKINDRGTAYDAVFVAGAMAVKVTSSGEELEETDAMPYPYHDSVEITDDNRRVITERRGVGSSRVNLPKKGKGEPLLEGGEEGKRRETGEDTVQPLAGWLLYEVADQPEDKDADSYWDSGPGNRPPWVPVGLAARVMELQLQDKAISTAVAES